MPDCHDRPAERFYKIVSSAAYNWDKSLVMYETYGAMGDLSWDEIYTVAMEQHTKGINLLIPHAVWYDESQVTFKPELSWRHPAYAARLPEFSTYLARLNVLLLNPAAHVADIAVLYPIATLQGSHHLDGPLGFYQGGVDWSWSPGIPIRDPSSRCRFNMPRAQGRTSPKSVLPCPTSAPCSSFRPAGRDPHGTRLRIRRQPRSSGDLSPPRSFPRVDHHVTSTGLASTALTRTRLPPAASRTRRVVVWPGGRSK